jgi:hypothetical protein
MRYFLLLISIIFLTGCATKIKYVERQSEELSRSVYATKDSLDMARLDLANKYAIESTKIVAPPKNKIKIESIIQSKADGSTQRVLILPTGNKDDKVINIGSKEYEELIKDVRIANQLKNDLNNWTLYSKEVERKLAEEYQIQSEMILKIQTLETQVLEKDKKLLKKDIAILWRNIVIVSLIGVIGLGVYLRIKGVL